MKAIALLRASLAGTLSGLLVAALSLALPRTYIANATVFFPSVNATLFKQMAQAMKADSTNTTTWSSAGPEDSQTLDAASSILRSRAAVNQALIGAGVKPSSRFSFWFGDPIESLRKNDVAVEHTDRNTLRVSVRYGRAEVARTICQSLLDYYTTFVHDHRLTNTARTREQIEKKLVRVDRRLTVLEGKLTRLSGAPTFGQTMLRPNSKTMREIWRKRLLEQGSSQRVLDEMRRVRQESRKERPTTTAEDADKDWMNRWGSSARSTSSLPNNVRQSEIPSRLELERVYEETLLLYHSALLQHDLLSTWEGLENSDFELIDPVAVTPEPVYPRMLLFAGYGALAGFVLSLLLRRHTTNRG